MLRSRQLDAILASGFSRESTEFHRDSRFLPKIVLTRERVNQETKSQYNFDELSLVMCKNNF
jgi:hypothetical protein